MDKRLDEKLKEAQETFDALAPVRERWKRKNAYYYRKLVDYYRTFVPEGCRVLEIGSGDGDLLAALKPSRGLGIDASPRFVEAARARHPDLEFRHGFAETLGISETFDAVILSDLVGDLDDIQLVLENLHRVSTPSTRILLNYYNYLWEPLLVFGSRVGLRMKQNRQSWLSPQDVENLLELSGFEVVRKTSKLLLPVGIPFLSDTVNRFLAPLPLLKKLCLVNFVIARPEPKPRSAPPYRVSVIVPCKNEKGNLEELVRRVPDMGSWLEILFIDGGSTDGSREELLRLQSAYPGKIIRIFDQTSPPGKGNAMREIFEKASGDVLLILDADLSVAPEDLVKFYRLLEAGRGELINGTRLVYPMEKQAMRFLNILGNKFFSLAFTFLLEQKIKDTLCGTKAFLRTDYLRIAANRRYFGDFDPFGDFDLLFGAVKLNLKIAEIPVRYYERRYGETKIHRFRHGFLLLKMCGIALGKLKFL